MYEAGDLLLVPLPFSDLSTSKRRPVLALTPPDEHGDFIACPITSRSHWTTARRLLPEHVDRGGLPLSSWVRTDRVVTLHVSIVAKSFGHAAETFRAGIAAELCRFISSA